MKFTKTNVKTFKGKSGLLDDVVEYVLNEWDNYDNKKSIVTDVLEHGCQSGCVGHLIYYSDTTRYYDTHKDEINTLLHEWLWSCGFKSPSELFGDKWDEEDPLALDTYNKNLLAWFGFEETLRNLARNFKELEDYC